MNPHPVPAPALRHLAGLGHRLGLALLALPTIGLAATEAPSSPSAVTVYSNNFDTMTLGATLAYPGAAGHGGWYQGSAPAPAYGEFQSTTAYAGKALREFIVAANTDASQTIDRRDLTAPNLATHPLITLSARFQAKSSDITALNEYNASLVAGGGPHPGYEIIAFGVYGGNGVAKQDSGANVGIAMFNGSNNNELVPLTVGQGLGWNAWHQITLKANQRNDRWVSITVDGQTQVLTPYTLPRSEDGGVWQRGSLIEQLSALIVAIDSFGDQTSDDIFWDTVSLTVDLPPEVLHADGFETVQGSP